MDDLVKCLGKIASYPTLHKNDREIVAKAANLIEAQTTEIRALRNAAPANYPTGRYDTIALAKQRNEANRRAEKMIERLYGRLGLITKRSGKIAMR